MILADACGNFSLVILTLQYDVLWGFVMLLHLRKIAIFSLQILLYHLQLCTLCIIQVNLAFAVVLEIKPNAEPSGQVVISVILMHHVFCDFIRVSLRGDIFHSYHCDM